MTLALPPIVVMAPKISPISWCALLVLHILLAEALLPTTLASSGSRTSAAATGGERPTTRDSNAEPSISRSACTPNHPEPIDSAAIQDGMAWITRVQEEASRLDARRAVIQPEIDTAYLEMLTYFLGLSVSAAPPDILRTSAFQGARSRRMGQWAGEMRQEEVERLLQDLSAYEPLSLRLGQLAAFVDDELRKLRRERLWEETMLMQDLEPVRSTYQALLERQNRLEALGIRLRRFGTDLISAKTALAGSLDQSMQAYECTVEYHRQYLVMSAPTDIRANIEEAKTWLLGPGLDLGRPFLDVTTLAAATSYGHAAAELNRRRAAEGEIPEQTPPEQSDRSDCFLSTLLYRIPFGKDLAAFYASRSRGVTQWLERHDREAAFARQPLGSFLRRPGRVALAVAVAAALGYLVRYKLRARGKRTQI